MLDKLYEKNFFSKELEAKMNYEIVSIDIIRNIIKNIIWKEQSRLAWHPHFSPKSNRFQKWHKSKKYVANFH